MTRLSEHLQSPAFMGLCLLSALAFGAATGNRSENYPMSDVAQNDLIGSRDGGWEVSTQDVSLFPEAVMGSTPAGDGAYASDPAKTKWGWLLATFVAGGPLVAAPIFSRRNLK